MTAEAETVCLWEETNSIYSVTCFALPCGKQNLLNMRKKKKELDPKWASTAESEPTAEPFCNINLALYFIISTSASAWNCVFFKMWNRPHSILSNKTSSRGSVRSVKQEEVLPAPGSTQSLFSIIYTFTQYILAACCNAADQIYLVPLYFNKRGKTTFYYPGGQNLMHPSLLGDHSQKEPHLKSQLSQYSSFQVANLSEFTQSRH